MAESGKPYVPSGDLEISQWDRGFFLADLSRQFHGAYVLITTEGPLPAEVRDCRLATITNDAAEIAFSLECDNDSETHFSIANPERITAHRNANGVTQSVEIRSLDGSVTRVWFGDAVRHRNREDLAA